MQIAGLGTDLLDIAEIETLLNQPGDHFLTRCFTTNEIADAGLGSNRIERLAGRFCAKEAVAKAMGVGAGDDFGWPDIEIRNETSGQPKVFLHGGAAKRAQELGITAWLISTSHTSSHALAAAIAISANVTVEKTDSD